MLGGQAVLDLDVVAVRVEREKGDLNFHDCLRWDGVALPRDPLYHRTVGLSPLHGLCQGQVLLVGYLLAMIFAAIA
jgi:hypothetical protein